jgi:pimeloyl-ACP methyl ester carboxylesterase
MKPSDPLCNLLNGIHARLTRKGVAFSSIGAMMASLQRKVLGSMVDLEALGCVAKRFKELAVTETELRTITIPVMAVKGGQDGLVPGGSDLKAVLPDFQETIIPGGRHNTVIFSSEFQAAIVNFLLAHSSEKN